MTVGVRRRERSALLSIVILSLMLTVLAQEVRTVASELRADNQHSAQVRHEVDSLRALEPSLLVLHSDAFPSEHWWRPFHSTATGLPAIQLGGNNQNPLMQAFLTRTGRQPLLRMLCQQPATFVVSEPDRLDFVTTYLREHFDEKVEWQEVYSGSFHVWRCVAAR